MNDSRHPTTRRKREQYALEADYSGAPGDDFEPLARDTHPVRSLEAADLGAIIRIDQHITGRDRSAYYRRKVSEVLEETGVRVSLVAEQDGHVVGFVMARVDYGEFGQTATTAVIDTIGVDPSAAGARVGQALISQLLGNLATLRIETVQTEVEWRDFALNRFLERCGFAPAQRLALSMPIE